MSQFKFTTKYCNRVVHVTFGRDNPKRHPNFDGFFFNVHLDENELSDDDYDDVLASSIGHPKSNMIGNLPSMVDVQTELKKMRIEIPHFVQARDLVTKSEMNEFYSCSEDGWNKV